MPYRHAVLTGGRARVSRYTRAWDDGRSPTYVATDPWRVELAADDPAAAELTLLAELVASRATLEERIALTVQQLRAAGASWTVVGDVLGVSRSAAQKRYGADALPLTGFGSSSGGSGGQR